MRKLNLYSTSACHLCEQAEAIVLALLDDDSVHLQIVDIALSDELIEKYGVRIPVLKFSDTDSELGWPFSEADFLEWLKSV